MTYIAERIVKDKIAYNIVMKEGIIQSSWPTLKEAGVVAKDLNKAVLKAEKRASATKRNKNKELE